MSLIASDKIINDEKLRVSSSKSNRLNSASSRKSIKEKEESPILHLPIEIICLIMSYLNLNDKKNASLISRRWRNSFEEGFMLKEIVVKGNENLIMKATNNEKLYEKAVNLEFKNDVNLTQFQDGVTISLNNLRHLILNSCSNLNSKILFNLLKVAPNLEKLHLIQCDNLFMNGFIVQTNFNELKLERLKELSLSKNRFLNDQIFDMFLEMSPNLTKLDMSYCFLTKTQFMSLKGYSNHENADAVYKLSSAIFTFENMCILIEKHGEKLKSLNLTGVDLLNKEENILKLLVYIENLNLNELVMENMNTLKVKTACKILNKQNKLSILNFNNSMQTQDDFSNGNYTISNAFELFFTELFDNTSGAMHDLCDTLTELRLKKLFFNANCYILYDISKLRNLRILDLSYCTFNTSFSNKTQLNLFIKQFASNLGMLKELEVLILSYCEFLVKDYLIKKISTNLTKLKQLDLRNCSYITDAALHFISKFLSNLEHLDISWCRKLTDYGLNRSLSKEVVLNYENSFQRHTSFGYCKCSICAKMLTNGIHRNNINEEEFDATAESIFTDEEVDVVSFELDTSLKYLKKLKVLRLENCTNITDFGLMNGINVTQLLELDIKLCTNITGNVLSKNENLNLKAFNISQCINFKNENLLEILKHAKHLRQLYASACPAMNNGVIDFLRGNSVILSILDVSYCNKVNERCMDLYEQFLFSEYCSRDFFIDRRFISKS